MQQERWNIKINGIVQGVGFRPFIYQLAKQLTLSGWVKNSTGGVMIEAEGETEKLEQFKQKIATAPPLNATIYKIEIQQSTPQKEQDFHILQSDNSAEKTMALLPDIATCEECIAELLDPANRRYRYPFINCTHCGPRYTIMTALPYDRAQTTMVDFTMCKHCLAEYKNPENRRFHAQPIACHECGPQIELVSQSGFFLGDKEAALTGAIQSIREGKIIALKGIGGFQLIANACDETTVKTLRLRKRRAKKPFALMYPSLEAAAKECEISYPEQSLLCSPQAPIVLLKKRASVTHIAPSVAPNNPLLGVMLPYSPLHHLLMMELNFPVVVTSGNLSGEPLCANEEEAIHQLPHIADIFLLHRRQIANRVDDSVVRIMGGKPMVLRSARGYAPFSFYTQCPEWLEPILAHGGYLKNTMAISLKNQMHLSPYIGDLKTPKMRQFQEEMLQKFCLFYDLRPEIIAIDKHPDSVVNAFDIPHSLSYQHHYSHILSCMIDHDFYGNCLGVAFDGTGYGDDDTLWGGEFLRISAHSYKRIGHLLPFLLPGGEAAIKEPRRAALGVLFGLQDSTLFEGAHIRLLTTFSKQEITLLTLMLERRINCFLTSSVGRLFDAVSALIGVSDENSFEGEAAMALEFAAYTSSLEVPYEFMITEGVIDWRPMVRTILLELEREVPRANIAARFHHTLGQMIVEMARFAAEETVILTGGCFQNNYLLELTIKALKEAGFQPLWHHRIPPNDGGLAAGQWLAAARTIMAMKMNSAREDKQCA